MIIASSKTSLKPPLYGSFPLDHNGECASLMKTYLKCLQEYHHEQSPCKNVAKAYLECRMERFVKFQIKKTSDTLRSLFQKHDMHDLGFQESCKETSEK